MRLSVLALGLHAEDEVRQKTLIQRARRFWLAQGKLWAVSKSK